MKCSLTAQRLLLAKNYLRRCATAANEVTEVTAKPWLVIDPITGLLPNGRKPRPPPNKGLPPQNIHVALALVKEQARAKFDETVEVAIKLNVDPRKQTQAVKGIASLPQGLGKTIKVGVFALGSDIELAKKAGADYAGGDDLIQMVQSGNIPFDRVVATPEMMTKLSKLGKVTISIL